MVVVGPQTRPGASPETAPRRSRRPLRLAMLLAAVIPALVLGLGFFWFLWRVPANEIALRDNADGIVVLTGGASRVADALELLATRRGRRLLITGVHHATRAVEIARTAPEFQPLFNCCVDLDRTAVNTVGNATETRRWARERDFHSLIVVTSNYHMPRAMAEIGNQLPDVTLIPYPVVPENWTANASSARLLLSEYLKYMVAVTRMRIAPAQALGRAPDAARLARNPG